MIRVLVKLIILESLDLCTKLLVKYLIVNLKINILMIAIQVKVMIGVEVKLIVVHHQCI